jgi:hypothetical protein
MSEYDELVPREPCNVGYYLTSDDDRGPCHGVACVPKRVLITLLLRVPKLTRIGIDKLMRNFSPHKTAMYDIQGLLKGRL